MLKNTPRRPARPPPQPSGFTLIEVLVALAIAGVALSAFVRMTSQTTTNLGHVEQRALAMLSAQNSIAELRIGSLPPPGVQVLECPQADLALVCRVRIGPSQQGLHAVTVEVHAGHDSGQRLASLRTHLPQRRR